MSETTAAETDAPNAELEQDTRPDREAAKSSRG